MRATNGPLAAIVAAVGVLAAIGGGVVAAQEGPRASGGRPAAAPLSETAPAGSAAAQPAAPSPAAAASTRVKIALADLPKGRPPRVPYLSGRVLRGGGLDLTIPGEQYVLDAARFDGGVLVLLEVDGGGAELARLKGDGSAFDPRRVPDVHSLVTSADGRQAAYATAWTGPDNAREQGSTVYWESAGGALPRRTLPLPEAWGSTVLGVVGDTVYFVSDTDAEGNRSALQAWQSRTGEVTTVDSVRSPVWVDKAGTVAVDLIDAGARTSCSFLVALRTEKRRWRTCEYSLDAVARDGRTVVASSGHRDGSATVPVIAALDAATGNVRRQWAGAQFFEWGPEDDRHLLFVADHGADDLDYDDSTVGAVVRCSLVTGACELATPLAEGARGTVRLLGARG